MKNIIKNTGDIFAGDKVENISLNLYHKESWTLLKYFTKSGHSVKCYYKKK